MNAVIHVSRFEDWAIAFANANNIKKESDTYGVAIVVNASAVKPFEELSSDLSAQIEKLTSQDIEVLLCANALRSNAIDIDSIKAPLTVVNAGVVEIMERQKAGYFYIKP